MKKILLLLMSTAAFGQSDREVGNRSLDKDTKLCVNDGGTVSCGIVVDGPTGDVKMDGTTLHVDSANDRVGVGTATPSKNLHISDPVEAALRLEDTGSSTFDIAVDTNGALSIDDVGLAEKRVLIGGTTDPKDRFKVLGDSGAVRFEIREATLNNRTCMVFHNFFAFYRVDVNNAPTSCDSHCANNLSYGCAGSGGQCLKAWETTGATRSCGDATGIAKNCLCVGFKP